MATVIWVFAGAIVFLAVMIVLAACLTGTMPGEF